MDVLLQDNQMLDRIAGTIDVKNILNVCSSGTYSGWWQVVIILIKIYLFLLVIARVAVTPPTSSQSFLARLHSI
jgi:hypothetical protein